MSLQFSQPFVEPTPRRVRVRRGDALVADSTRAQLLVQYGDAGLPTYYLPMSGVRPDALVDEAQDGGRRTWTVSVGGRQAVRVKDTFVPDAAWSYPDPIAENPKIRDLLCFVNERVDLVVDGEQLPRPRTPWS
jgi:uncharacterized protein (DUF427 family)